METLQGLEREVGRLQAEVFHLNKYPLFFINLFNLFNLYQLVHLKKDPLFFILIVLKVDRLRREGEEGRRRSSSQEAHYRTTEQVGFYMF